MQALNASLRQSLYPVNSLRHLPTPTGSGAGHPDSSAEQRSAYQHSTACDTRTDSEMSSVADTTSQRESTFSTESKSTTATTVSLDFDSAESPYPIQHERIYPNLAGDDQALSISLPAYSSRSLRKRPRNLPRDALKIMKAWMSRVRSVNLYFARARLLTTRRMQPIRIRATARRAIFRR